ncbi:MAG: hypothetical protein OSA21_02345 [Candidatus Poseidoniaceae archaeon]|nr:hypothetical protein [Candidatus Poseidoniaceae archaeon]
MEAEVETKKDSTNDGDILLQLATNETSLFGLIRTLPLFSIGLQTSTMQVRSQHLDSFHSHVAMDLLQYVPTMGVSFRGLHSKTKKKMKQKPMP